MTGGWLQVAGTAWWLGWSADAAGLARARPADCLEAGLPPPMCQPAWEAATRRIVVPLRGGSGAWRASLRRGAWVLPLPVVARGRGGRLADLHVHTEGGSRGLGTPRLARLLRDPRVVAAVGARRVAVDGAGLASGGALGWVALAESLRVRGAQGEAPDAGVPPGVALLRVDLDGGCPPVAPADMVGWIGDLDPGCPPSRAHLADAVALAEWLSALPVPEPAVVQVGVELGAVVPPGVGPEVLVIGRGEAELSIELRRPRVHRPGPSGLVAGAWVALGAILLRVVLRALRAGASTLERKSGSVGPRRPGGAG